MKPENKENPEYKIQSQGLLSISPKQLTKVNSSRNNDFQQYRNILKKNTQFRTPSDNQTLLKMGQNSDFIKEISQKYGNQFLKGILKNAKIQNVDEKQVIVDEGNPLNYFIVVLQGKLGVQKSKNETIQTDIDKNSININEMQLKIQDIFQKLSSILVKQKQLQKKGNKLQRKSSFPQSQYQFNQPILSTYHYSQFLSNIKNILMSNNHYGARQRLQYKKYRNRIVAMQKSTILIFQIKFIQYYLQLTAKNKIKKTIQKLKSIPIFEKIQNQKLVQIVKILKINKKKMNQFIYVEGQKAQHIFILLTGQIKILKQTNLFKQNPNDLYTDRRLLMRMTHRQQKNIKIKKKQDDILPYANFTTLYNYRPIKKTIQLGVLSSFGIFGQQQIAYKTKRQTSIQVNCIQAQYYEIQFKKILQIIGNKLVDQFLQQLLVSVSKKVLLRQSQYAEHIQFQNKTNMNYFYIDSSSPTKQSPRKVKLEKINQKIIPKINNQQNHHQPAYTTFNFNKMFNKRYSQPKSARKSSQNSVDQDLYTVSYSKNQQKLIGFSHSWNSIQNQVKQQKKMSRRISPFKPQISIKDPLIDQQFFRDMAKQKRRINRESRNLRLSLKK